MGPARLDLPQSEMEGGSGISAGEAAVQKQSRLEILCLKTLRVKAFVSDSVRTSTVLLTASVKNVFVKN